MKNFRVLLVLPCAIVTVVLLSFAGCGRGQGSVVLECGPDSVADLGAVREADGPVCFRIALLNNGADTLFPLETSTNCSCLTADAERKPVAPGDRMTIDASFNPFGSDGEVSRELKVFCEGRVRRQISLRVKACVEPVRRPLRKDCPFNFGHGLHLSNATLNFGSRGRGGTEEFRLRVASSLNRSAVVTLDIPEELDTLLKCRTVELGAGGRDTVSVRLNIPEQGFGTGVTTISVHPVINGKRCRRPLEITCAGID